MRSDELAVPRWFRPAPPELLRLTHARPGKLTVGDEAWCRHLPGLLRLLFLHTPESSAYLATGTHPMTGIPVGMAMHAAIEACDVKSTGLGISRWVEASMESPLGQDDTVLSHGRIEELGKRHVLCTAEAYAEEEPLRLLVKVRVALVHVVDKRAVSIEHLWR